MRRSEHEEEGQNLLGGIYYGWYGDYGCGAVTGYRILFHAALCRRLFFCFQWTCADCGELVSYEAGKQRKVSGEVAPAAD